MPRLDRTKLDTLLAQRGMTLGDLAQRSRISRQSLYNMFRGTSIFAVPFEKMLKELGVPFEELLAAQAEAEDILAAAPPRIKKAALELMRYAARHHADLYLIGSRTRGAQDIRSDWDFGIYFPKKQRPADFARTKQALSEQAFPHRVDIVELSAAPAWFLTSIATDARRIAGATPRETIFETPHEKESQRRIA